MRRSIRAFFAFLLVPALCLVLCAVPARAAGLYLLGDVDLDGSITSADARYALRNSLLLDKYVVAGKKLSDVDGDGDITSADARLILRVSVGLDSLYGAVVSIKDSEFTEPAGPGSDKPSDSFEHYVPPMPAKSTEHGMFTYTVYGYGHGVGMSQYGAVTLDGMGRKYNEILNYYYTGIAIGFDTSYPETTRYAGSDCNTEELVARIVYQEIYGITSNGKYIEACKAQAVAVFTNIKRLDFSIATKYTVGYASDLSYERLPAQLKNAVKQVIGEYIYVAGDAQKKPVQAVYSGAAAGMSASSEDVWGGYLSYLVPVESSFDLKERVGERTYYISAEKMRSLIKAYDSSIVLSDDPAGWIEIIEHSGSVDSLRGYVSKVRVGNKYLSGYSQFTQGLMSAYNGGYSSCFYIQYTE